MCAPWIAAIKKRGHQSSNKKKLNFSKNSSEWEIDLPFQPPEINAAYLYLDFNPVALVLDF